MTGTTFRQEPQEAADTQRQVTPANTSSTPVTSSVEVPYLDYETQHGKPYVVDLFELGQYWEPYGAEIKAVEGYLEGKIKDGEIANDTKTIRAELKKMERLLNLKDESRTAVKLGVLAAHIKFLQETDNIKADSVKYGH